MVLFIVAGIVVSAWLGIRGLLRGEMDLTYGTTLTGKSAKFAALLCIMFACLLVALTVWFFSGFPGL